MIRPFGLAQLIITVEGIWSIDDKTNLAILLDCPGQIGIMNVRWVRDILSLLSPSAPWPTFDKIPDESQQRVRCRQVSQGRPQQRRSARPPITALRQDPTDSPAQRPWGQTTCPSEAKIELCFGRTSSKGVYYRLPKETFWRNTECSKRIEKRGSRCRSLSW